MLFLSSCFPTSWGRLGGGVANFHSCLTSMGPNINSYAFTPEATHSFVKQTQGLMASMSTAWLTNTNWWGNFWPRSFWIWGALQLMKCLLSKNKQTNEQSKVFLPQMRRTYEFRRHLTLKIHFLSFGEHLVASAASCTAGVVMFVTCLQEKREGLFSLHLVTAPSLFSGPGDSHI